MMFLLHLDDSLSGSGLWGRKGSKNRPFRGCQGVRGAGETVSARASDAAASHRARAVDLAVHPRIGEEPKKGSSPIWGMRDQVDRAGSGRSPCPVGREQIGRASCRERVGQYV